jgi:hypothetical protein
MTGTESVLLASPFVSHAMLYVRPLRSDLVAAEHRLVQFRYSRREILSGRKAISDCRRNTADSFRDDGAQYRFLPPSPHGYGAAGDFARNDKWMQLAAPMRRRLRSMVRQHVYK